MLAVCMQPIDGLVTASRSIASDILTTGVAAGGQGQGSIGLPTNTNNRSRRVGSCGVQLPLPAFTSTYAYSFTRGFWFTAPADFTICSLQVPDESGHGSQDVEVVRFNTVETATSATNDFTSLHRSIGVSSASEITSQYCCEYRRYYRNPGRLWQRL
jgi:hypothetical protein